MLAKANEGFVDGGIAVGVVIFEDFADDTGAFIEWSGADQAFSQHSVEDTALDGFQSIADVGQCAADDDGHGVVDIGPLHDFSNIGWDDFFLSILHVLWEIKVILGVLSMVNMGSRAFILCQWWDIPVIIFMEYFRGIIGMVWATRYFGDYVILGLKVERGIFW
jgi:hypothetical protein